MSKLFNQNFHLGIMIGKIDSRIENQMDYSYLILIEETELSIATWEKSVIFNLLLSNILADRIFSLPKMSCFKLSYQKEILYPRSWNYPRRILYWSASVFCFFKAELLCQGNISCARFGVYLISNNTSFLNHFLKQKLVLICMKSNRVDLTGNQS